MILGAIATLMITHFGVHVFGTVAGGAHAPGYTLSDRLAAGLAGMAPGTAHLLAEVSWWIHVTVVLAFLNYLLYSKHSHIVAALPNIYFRNLGQRGVLPKLNLEADDMSQTGIVSEYKDFTWKSLAGHVRLHRMRPLHQLLPGVQHRQAAVAHARRARRARRPAGQDARPRAAGRAAGTLPARRGGREEPQRRHPAGRRSHDRRSAVGLHHLRRLPGGLPGVHRSARS